MLPRSQERGVLYPPAPASAMQACVRRRWVWSALQKPGDYWPIRGPTQPSGYAGLGWECPCYGISTRVSAMIWISSLS